MTADWPQTGMGAAAVRIRELTESLDAMASQLPVLADAISRLDADVDLLMSERGETGTALARHEEGIRELAAAMKRLATQVTWIERHIRSSGSARAIDFDHVDPDLSALAATTDAGRRVAAELLTPMDRAALETTESDHRDALRRRREVVATLLDACARLVSTERDDAVHGEARADYVSSRGRLAEATQRVANLADRAKSAHERLTADDDERRRHAATIAAGERAELELLTRLRTKLAAAVADGVLLPPWLTGPLGPMPAAGAAQRWMDVAAGLLAYRITYAVDDPEDATGELPESAAAHRRRWHADLGRGVRELRR